MKRSPELSPLSRDHHKALAVALRLRRAEDVDAAKTAALFFDYWRDHGAHHFRIEEEILLPGWVDGDPVPDRALAARVAEEHLEIRIAVRRLERGDSSRKALRELGGLLERHVRFEERELFPRIEAGLDPRTIVALGEQIDCAERAG